MDNELRYVEIDKNFKDIDKVEDIYISSFPPNERPMSVKKSFEIKGLNKRSEVVYDGNDVVGFYFLELQEKYVYLEYIAVNQKIRSKGYGGRILSKLLDTYKDKVFFCSIEKPILGEEGYENKIRRQAFYEKNGMSIVDVELIYNGTVFICATNKTGPEFEECYKQELIRQEKILKMNADLF